MTIFVLSSLTPNMVPNGPFITVDIVDYKEPDETKEDELLQIYQSFVCDPVVVVNITDKTVLAQINDDFHKFNCDLVLTNSPVVPKPGIDDCIFIVERSDIDPANLNWKQIVKSLLIPIDEEA